MISLTNDNKGSQVTLMYTYNWLQAAHEVSLDCVITFDTLYRCIFMQFNDRQSLCYKAVTPINAVPVQFTTVQTVQLWLHLSIARTHMKDKPAIYPIVIKQLKSVQPYTQT